MAPRNSPSGFSASRIWISAPTKSLVQCRASDETTRSRLSGANGSSSSSATSRGPGRRASIASERSVSNPARRPSPPPRSSASAVAGRPVARAEVDERPGKSRSNRPPAAGRGPLPRAASGKPAPHSCFAARSRSAPVQVGDQTGVAVRSALSRQELLRAPALCQAWAHELRTQKRPRRVVIGQRSAARQGAAARGGRCGAAAAGAGRTSSAAPPVVAQADRPKHWAKISFLEAPVCDGCKRRRPMTAGADARCPACLAARKRAFDRVRAAVAYDDASRDLILKLKRAPIAAPTSPACSRSGSPAPHGT